MSDAMGTLNQKIDSLVFDCFQKSSDIILQGRRCTLEPEIVLSGLQPGIQTFKDNSDYCCQVLRDWRVNLNSPLVLDVSLLDLDSKEFHLMERWKIIYKRKDDTKDGRLSSVSRRIITLMRTLYCFVRLLPGFQLLNMCPKTPLVTFRLYNPEHPSSRNFVSESSYYDFPRIQTFRGTLYLGVRYMAANVLQVTRKGASHAEVNTSRILIH
jgi:Autophagy-related protein 13